MPFPRTSPLAVVTVAAVTAIVVASSAHAPAVRPAVEEPQVREVDPQLELAAEQLTDPTPVEPAVSAPAGEALASRRAERPRPQEG